MTDTPNDFFFGDDDDQNDVADALYSLYNQ